MIIRCWGARGSIPVSGSNYVKYGGDTTCIEIRTKEDEVVIIDAGSGIRRLGGSLLAQGRFRYTMFFTHAHWDHLMGFPFFKPVYSSKSHITILGCPFAQSSVRQMISKVMAPPNFPVKFESIKANITYHETCTYPYSMGSLTVIPIELSHPNQGVGYKFTEEGKTFVFLTDNELSFRHPGGLEYKDYLNFVSQVDLLIHDAEFTEHEYKKTKGWGHSTYKEALKLALEGKVKRLGLFHHNQERSDEGIDEIVRDCHNIINKKRSKLECFALHQDMEVEL
ncbi:MAG: MBL fold metallo-hydrolase [Smithellaceae bacterium]|nr:MBL fold metallo-hydrolase [Smithellaceae bacterium]